MHRFFLWPHLLTVLLSAHLAGPATVVGADPEDEDGGSTAAAGRYNDEHRFVFHAVLEGLFQDGVTGEALTLIVPDPGRMVDPEHPERTNFVYSCPLCMPVFDAFRVYLARPTFYGQKVTRYDTFGGGLPDKMLARLRGAPIERRQAVRDLIQRYVSRRLERTDLDEEEMDNLELRLAEMKQDGHKALAELKAGKHGEEFVKFYEGWEYCPNCVGISPDEDE